MSQNKAGKEGLIYKGHPLRRIDNLIYYGSMADKYIIMMQVMNTKKEQDLELATKVSVQLQLTDPTLKSRDRVVKKSEKSNDKYSTDCIDGDDFTKTITVKYVETTEEFVSIIRIAEKSVYQSAPQNAKIINDLEILDDLSSIDISNTIEQTSNILDSVLDNGEKDED